MSELDQLYITKVDLARNAKLFSGETSNLGGSIILGEDLTVEGEVILPGLDIYSGTNYKVLVKDENNNKVYEKHIDDVRIYNGPSRATVDLNGITKNEILSGRTYDSILADILSPYVVPTITSTITPQLSPYNAIDIFYTVTFRSEKPLAQIDNINGQIQYKRGNETTWNDLITTNATVSSELHNIIVNITINNGSVNNNTVDFRVIITDLGNIITGSTVSATFQPYISPSSSLSLNPVPFLSNNKTARSLNISFINTINGIITRNSPLINISQYKVQRDYGDNIWVDIMDYNSVPSNGGPISSVTDSAQPTNKDLVRYRLFVLDSELYRGQVILPATQLGIYQPILYGMSTATNVTNVDLSTLNNVPNGVNSGQVNYSNTPTDKVINGLLFTASINRFCIAFDNDYGGLINFFDVDTQTNLLSNSNNFMSGTKNIVFTDGTTKTYRVLLYNSVILNGNYLINIG